MEPSDLLCGDHVRLDGLTSDDVPTLVRWYQDATFLRLYDSRPAHPKSREEIVQWLEELRKEKNTYAFAVRPVESEDLLGYLELDGIIWQHGVCGMGLGIGDRAQRGLGYGREATELALRFAFHELNLHRVQVTVFAYNENSIALIEKLGFRREGAFREFLQRDGKRFDMILYGLLRNEWEAAGDEQKTTGG